MKNTHAQPKDFFYIVAKCPFLPPPNSSPLQRPEIKAHQDVPVFKHLLVGGFNPSENISQVGSFPQVGVKNTKCLKPPPSLVWVSKTVVRGWFGTLTKTSFALHGFWRLLLRSLLYRTVPRVVWPPILMHALAVPLLKKQAASVQWPKNIDASSYPAFLCIGSSSTNSYSTGRASGTGISVSTSSGCIMWKQFYQCNYNMDTSTAVIAAISCCSKRRLQGSNLHRLSRWRRRPVYVFNGGSYFLPLQDRLGLIWFENKPGETGKRYRHMLTLGAWTWPHI